MRFSESRTSKSKRRSRGMCCVTRGDVDQPFSPEKMPREGRTWVPRLTAPVCGSTSMTNSPSSTVFEWLYSGPSWCGKVSQ